MFRFRSQQVSLPLGLFLLLLSNIATTAPTASHQSTSEGKEGQGSSKIQEEAGSPGETERNGACYYDAAE